jgi:hypothetical protein
VPGERLLEGSARGGSERGLGADFDVGAGQRGVHSKEGVDREALIVREEEEGVALLEAAEDSQGAVVGTREEGVGERLAVKIAQRSAYHEPAWFDVALGNARTQQEGWREEGRSRGSR